MKKSQLRQLIREELLKIDENTYVQGISDNHYKKIIDLYKRWESESYKNYSDKEGKEWTTKDAKIEILQTLRDTLNKNSKNNDTIKITI